MQTKFLEAQISVQGQIDVYFELVQDDGKKRLHSVSVVPTDDPADRLIAVNNSIVNDFKFPAVTSEQWAPVAAECAAKHTPAVKQAFAAWMAENAKKV